jgi:hypothetical protein
MPRTLDLAESPFPIPERFHAVRYNGARYPGTGGGLELGANCQKFAYEFIRHFGYEIADFRSSGLWEDTAYTRALGDSEELKALDLVLFNRNREAWGAHVGVSLGGGLVLHLSKGVGGPAIWHLDRFAGCLEYACLIGAKAPVRLRGHTLGVLAATEKE